MLAGYTCKDEGEADIFLGMQAEWQNDYTVLLHQERYMRDLVKRFEEFLPTRRFATPMAPGWKLTDADLEGKCSAEHAQLYQMILGGLIYPANLTACVLSQPVAFLARYMSDPCKKAFKAAVRVLAYVSQQPKIGYKLNSRKTSERRPSPRLVTWVDAAYANQHKSRSTMGQVFCTVYGLLSWRCKTAPGVPLSSTEAEIIALVFAVRELLFLRELFVELGFTVDKQTTVFEDNEATIAIASQVGVSDRTKHMEIKYHFLRHKLESEVFKLVHLPGDRMVADMFTKPLPGGVLSGHLKSITRVVQDPTMAVEESASAAEEEEARFRDEEDAQIDRAVQGKIKAIHSAGDWRKMRSLKLKRQKIVQKATVRSKAPAVS